MWSLQDVQSLASHHRQEMAYQTYRQAEPIQVRRLAMRSQDEVNRLFEENKWLYYACLRHFIRKYRTIPIDDVISAVDEAVTRSLHHYDPERGKLGAILYRSAEQKLMWYIKYANAQKRLPPKPPTSLDQAIRTDTDTTLLEILPSSTNIEEEVAQRELIELWLKSLTKRERQVAALRYLGYENVEIGRKLGVSRERVGQIVRNIRLKYERAARDDSPEAARESNNHH